MIPYEKWSRAQARIGEYEPINCPNCGRFMGWDAYDEGERQKVAEAMNSLFKEKPDIYQGVEETTNV